MGSTLFLFLSFCIRSFGATHHARQDAGNTAVIDLATTRGNPQHLASGFIYGIPDPGFDQSPDQIPSQFYTDIGFNYARAGGAQMTAGGWIDGMTAYAARFNSTKSNYETARQYGARFQILPHDIWGTDHANSSTVWPGDNGDWSNYDEFLDTLLSDLKANDMLDGLDYEIWNEPDGGFWQRSASQFYELWVRTYQRVRSDSSFADVLVVGPSTASQPYTGNVWWENWLQSAVGNNTIPDRYIWHDEPGDPAADVNNLPALLQAYNAPERSIIINEYAVFSQQVSTGAAWFISRLERYDIQGLRGNWLSTCQLHDFMASLVGKADTASCNSASGYYGNGEFQVYKYYNQNMTGVRATTTGSGDGVLDVYTTIGSDKVRTLTGVNLKTGTWYITINNLSSVGLPTSGTLNIQTWGFDDAGHFGEVSGPSNRGIYGHSYSGNTVTFPVFQTTQDEYTAWGFEFNVA